MPQGYPGGPTPPGFTPHEDGTGRMMYDEDGNLHVNPNYAEWLLDPEQQIDWTGVATDLATYGGAAVGFLSGSQVIQWTAWGITSPAQWIDLSHEPPRPPGEGGSINFSASASDDPGDSAYAATGAGWQPSADYLL